jgi:hypothetical protein
MSWELTLRKPRRHCQKKSWITSGHTMSRNRNEAKSSQPLQHQKVSQFLFSHDTILETSGFLNVTGVYLHFVLTPHSPKCFMIQHECLSMDMFADNQQSCKPVALENHHIAFLRLYYWVVVDFGNLQCWQHKPREWDWQDS